MYIARLQDGRFYVGLTQQGQITLLAEHLEGRHSSFTRGHRITRIEWHEAHPTLDSGRKRELQLKRWTHAKKQALIHGDFSRLKALARSRQRWPR